MIRLVFACGHRLEIEDAVSPVSCGQCHETRVSRVDAPAPTFRGTVKGPHTIYEAGAIGPLALAVPLKLKESVNG